MTTPTIATRFIILAGARTGSSVLAKTLHSHPDCYCNGHPFFENEKRTSALRPEARAAMDLNERATDPVQYAYNVLNFSNGPSVVGFKIWAGKDKGSHKALAVLGADPDIKKIILNRSNHLACQSSGDLVRMKQKHPAAFSDDRPRPQIHFDRDTFLNTTKRRTKFMAQYREIAQGDVIEIPYIGLMETGIHAISDFLHLSDFAFKTRMKKRNTSDIIGRFRPEYHSDIKRVLDHIGHPEWAHEE